MSATHDRGKETEGERLKAKREVPEQPLVVKELVSDIALPLGLEAQALTDPRFASSANNGRKTQVLLHLQRTHGNTYVQRLVAQGIQPQTSLVKQAEEENRRGEAYEVSPPVGARIDAQRDLGQPLDAQTRMVMEETLGQNLSDVRVHTDTEADRLARETHAEAFTTDSDVFFRQGRYDPESPEGEELLAHELTHVVQQEHGINASGSIQRVDGEGGGEATASEPAPAAPTEVSLPPDAVIVSYEGQDYILTPAERDALMRGLVKKLQPAVQQIKSKAESARFLYDYFVKLNNDQYVVSFFAELFGGAEMPAATVISDAEAAANLANDCVAAGTDLTGSIAAIEDAELKVNQAINAMEEYRGRVISGAETTITILEVTKTASFATVGVLGGAVLAAPLAAGGAGLGLATSGAISGGGAALLDSIASSTGEAIFIGQQSLGDAALKAIKDTAVGAITGGASAGFASRLAGPVVDGLYKALGSKLFGEMAEEAAKQIIRNSFEGGIGNAIQGAFTDVIGMLTSDTTWGQLAEHIVENLIAGGIAGAIQARLPVARGV